MLENRTIEKLILQATANRVHSSFPILASSMLEAFSPLTGFHASLGCVNVNGLTRFYRVRGHRHFRGGRLKYPPKSREIIEWKEDEDVMDGELNRCENAKKKERRGGSILKDKAKDYRR